MDTVQYAWRGSWYNLCGAPKGRDEMEGYVERSNARCGYGRFRVADASTEGETGAPEKPVRAIVHLPPAQMSEWLTLVGRHYGDNDLSPEESGRMKDLMDQMHGEVIGASDDSSVEKALQDAYRAKQEGPT